MNAPAPRPQQPQAQAPRPGSLSVGRASGPQNLSVARPKPPTLAPIARPKVPTVAPPAPTNPLLDGLKTAGDFTGGINKAAVDTVTGVGKALAGTAQRSVNTLGQAGVGVVGAVDTASSLMGGDQVGAAKKNQHYTQMLDDIGSGTAIDGGKTSYISKDIQTGKASPVEFGKSYIDAGTEASSLIPMGGAVKGAVQSGTKLTGQELAKIGLNNAKQATVFGTSTTANDAIQGRKIDAGTLAMNYGAPLVLGAGSETLGRIVGAGAKDAGKGTLRAAVEANRKVEQFNPKVKEIDEYTRPMLQKSLDTETNPHNKRLISEELARLNAERRMLTQGGYVGNRPAMDAVSPDRPVAPVADKVAPTVKAKIEELRTQEDLKPTLKEEGRYVQSNDFVPENASGSLVRKAQMINKQADEAIKSQVRLETQVNMSNGIPMAQARKMAEEKVLARPDLAQMQQNRTAALAKAIENDSVKQIDVKGPRNSNVDEFVGAPSVGDDGKPSFELVPLDNERHTLKNGSVVDKNGRSVGSYVGIDKDGNQIAYVEGKPVNINKVVGDVGAWGNVNNTFMDMDRLIELNAPNKETARKVQEFTTVFKDQQEALMKTEIAGRRKDLSEVEAAITSDIPNGIKKEELSKDMFRMMEQKVDMNEMRQKYGANYIDKEVVPVLRWARTTFDEMLDNTNRVLVRNGFDEIPRRDNYITHIQEDPHFWEKFGIGIQDLNPFGSSVSSDANPGKLRGAIPDAIVGNTDATGARRKFNPFAQTRKGDQMQQDFFAAMDAYVEPMAFNEFMTPAASRSRIIERTFRAYEKAREIKFDQLAEIVGLDEARKLTPTKATHKNYAARRGPLVLAWQEYGNMLAGKTNSIDRFFMQKGESGSKFVDTATKAQGIVGASAIPGSTTAALAQVLSLPQTIARDSATSVLKASRDMLNFGDRGNKTDPFLQSNFMRARYTDASSQRKTKMQKYLSTASKPMEIIEHQTGELSWRSAYHEAIKKGKTGRDAVRTADIETKKTLAGRGIGDRPENMNSKTLGLVTQFGLEVNNMRLQFWKDFTPKQKLKFMVSAAALNTIYGGLTGQTPLPDFIKAGLDTFGDLSDSSDDSKDDLQTNLLQGGQRVLGEASKFVPGASTLAGFAMSDRDRESVFGKNSDLSRFGTPAATRVIGAAKDVLDGTTSGDASKVRDGVLSVTPTGSQVKRSLEGGETINQGYVTNSKGNVQNTVDQGNPLDVAQGLTFGKYALPGQQNAMNRNSALSDKQSARFKELYKTDKNAAKEYFDSIMKRKADNPRAGTLTDVGSDSVSAASPDTNLSVAELIEKKATRNEDLKNSMSLEDQDIMSLTKAERAKLVEDGTLTQEKVDGLQDYYDNKRSELGFDDSKSGGKKDTGWMDEYTAAKKEFDKSSKDWSVVKKASKQKDLNLLDVKKHYAKDTTTLYGMNKQDVWNLVSEDDNGNKLVEDVLKYGDALVAAGLSTKNKFRDKNGNVVLSDAKAKGSGGKGGKKGSGAAAAKSTIALASSLNKIRTPKTTGTKGISTDSIAPPQMKKAPLKRYAVKQAASSTKKPVVKTKKA